MERPTLYTDELAITICERLMEPMSLRKVCLAEDMPDKSTVCRWLARGDGGEKPYDEFRRLYEAAREVQADAYQDELVDIADEATATPEDVAKAKLRISTRQWNAEKLRPKKYGPASKVEHTGGGGAPLSIAVELVKAPVAEPE